MKKALILVGKGNSGKSVLKNFLTKLIGLRNCSNIDLERMEDRFGKVNLLNKRLVGSNDMSFVKTKELGVFKQAVAGDPIYAEYKGENGINFIFNGVLWFCCNDFPLFGGDKGSHVYDRFVIIKCDNVIPEEQRDKKLVEHLMEEKDYIVSLLVKSLLQVISNGYKYDIPESSKKLLEDLTIELKVLKLDQKINQSLQKSLEDNQKEFVLREKIREIEKELGEENKKCL